MGAGPLRKVGGLEEPRAIRVITSPDGTPHAVIAGGRRRLVIAVREDWLIQDRWWTDAPVDRHYHELLVEPGTIVTVYRDVREGGWFSHFPAPGGDRPAGAASARSRRRAG